MKNNANPEIIIGIPSYNEADTISQITKIIDQGLETFFSHKKSLIVNADNNSPDNTKEAFLSVETRTPKKYISTPPGVMGKGNNFKNLFKFFIESKAQKLMMIDADINSAEPSWVKKLITPIDNGFDCCLPVYFRGKYDGSITNHFCYPIIRGLLGIDVRQPIGGDISLSRRMVKKLYHSQWPIWAHGYGIDIFITTTAIFSKLKIAETYLGAKDHKPSETKLFDMFKEVSATLFEMLDRHKNFWDRQVELKKIAIFSKQNKRQEYPLINIDREKLEKIAKQEFKNHELDIKKITINGFESLKKSFQDNNQINILTTDWIEIIFKFITSPTLSPIKKALAIRPLYLGRFLTFHQETLRKDDNQAEKMIIEQANSFYQKRKTA